MTEKSMRVDGGSERGQLRRRSAARLVWAEVERVVESREASMPVRSEKWEKATVASASWRWVRRWRT